ncbi:MAG: NAD(P)-dependent oxidoreductase [Bacteroidetes bacterium]|nr:NAD(P)-dependent oxidoreductase [Bacteroidota bacterium]
MKILVTGGSGFIGTNVVQYYLDNQTDVVNIDIHPPRDKNHITNWINVDLLDEEKTRAAIKLIAPTHVIHLAARTDLNGNSLEDYAINTRGTINLLTSLSQLNTIQKVIFASSMLVCRVGYIPVNDEDYSPSNIYGESKKQMEILLRKYSLPFEWIIIRPTSIWGPWFDTPYRDFFDKVYQRKYFNIRDKACTKTYGFVYNSVYQIDKLLKADTPRGSMYYIGDDPPINISDWADEIAFKLGNSKFISVPYYIFKFAALFGDVLKKAGISFPMTSFRLKNMTTDNILPLENTTAVAGRLPYNRESAIEITLQWLNYNKTEK